VSHPDLRSYLAALPKIELHRHLEGAIRLQTLVEVAREHDLDLPARSAEGLRAHVQITPADTLDSVHFLSKFAILRRFFVSPEVIKRVAREAVADAARDNIRYMELRFTPKALAKLMNYPFDEVVRWVADAVREEQAKHPIQVRLIVAVNRHESIGEAERQIVAAVAHRRDGVVGVDLCGQEVGFSAAPFLPIFREAHQDGLGITIHAGEWDTAHNIGYAIEHIGASRIGHGVRVLENSSVVMMARLVGVTFEVCPTSNLQSGVIKQIERHPIREMMEIGLRTTLNTDDPAISNITLTDEYHTAIERLGITIENVRQAVRHAAEASFLPMLERERLAVEIDSTIAGVPVVSNR
jgi:adenosine deaminase